MKLEIDSRMTLRLERVAEAQRLQIDQVVDLILDGVLADPKLMREIFGAFPTDKEMTEIFGDDKETT